MPRILLFVVLAIACRAGADPVAIAIARLETEAASIDPAALHPQLADAVKAARDAVAAAKNASDPVVRLYRLRDAWVATETLTFFAAHREAQESLAAFETLYEREKKSFAQRTVAARPELALSAFAQAARNRAWRLADASLPYARASAPFGGLYYLAEARANLRYAQLVESLPRDAAADPRPPAASLAAAADEIERETLAFFGSDPANRGAIPVSAKLKETRELLRSGASDGATLLLLETRRELTRRRGDKPSEEKPAVPRDSLAALWQSIDPAVLPFYQTLTTTKRAAAPRSGPVKVTLLRWPYT